MRAVFWISILSTAGFIVMAIEPCTRDHLEYCTNANKKKYRPPGGGTVYLRSELEFTEYCNDKEFADNCVSDFFRRCMPDEATLSLYFQDLSLDVCMEGQQAKRAYLQHRSCYVNFGPQLMKCMDSFLEFRKWNDRVVKDDKKSFDRETAVRRGCCHFEQSLHCMNNVIRSGCPNDAAIFFNQLTDTTGKQMATFLKCNRFRYDIANCNSSTSHFVLSLWCVVVMFTALIHSSHRRG